MNNVVITERMPDDMPQWIDDAMSAGTLFSEIKARYLMEDLLLEEQRKLCGDAVSDECDKINITYGTELITLDDGGLLIDACLNATRKNEPGQ